MPRGIKKAVVKEVEATEVSIVPTEVRTMQAQETASIENFIGQAIQQGLPVETMERFFALRKEVKAEQAKEAFTAAMAAFQGECPVIVKDKEVWSGNKLRYSYAPLDSIVNQVRAYLGKNGLSYTVDVKTENGILTATCKITHILGHSETSSFEAPIDKDSYMSAPQKYASASTFAKRYAFCNALGILTGDQDTDAADLPGGALSTPEKPAIAAENPVLANYKKSLENAKDMVELGRIWADMPVQAKTALNSVKEEMKAILASAKNDEGN